jgi:hypothetical protein
MGNAGYQFPDIPDYVRYTLKIMRGIQPEYEEESFFALFIDGVKLCIINILYMIIPLIAFTATIGYAVYGIIMAGGNFSFATLLPLAGGLLSGLILTIVLAIIFFLLNVIASVRFARTESFFEAFALREIVATISTIGWIRYIFSLVFLMAVVIVIMIVVTIIEVILGVIPILGIILGWLISLFLGPYISIMTSRFYSLIYNDGV